MQLVVSALRDVRNIIPYTQFAEKILYTRVRNKRISSNSLFGAYSPIALSRTRVLYKVSDLERMLKYSYREKDKIRLEY